MLATDFPSAPQGDDTATYIVRLRDNVTQYEMSSFIRDVKGQAGTAAIVNCTFTGVFKGFTARMKPAYMQSLKDHNIIRYIEPNRVFRVGFVDAPPPEPQN
ncbi:hypothetical protein M407DRAFT_242088 [Tulasnella calospora MUT 4182]|uniref:Inhibitor I9 domain-containing protein n=1 Tax=Tulasnella calospora MUT 4182 TaxID=1051891 RepID=A0A0C3L9U3_9AGAM|nr:hypothetical protein M407DRAFT_242088 [Tulasnella calospora MUT 4182]